MMNNTGRVLGFNFYEMWQMPHADESFALIMVKLNKEVPEMMDDTYVESIIYQLRQLVRAKSSLITPEKRLTPCVVKSLSRLCANLAQRTWLQTTYTVADAWRLALHVYTTTGLVAVCQVTARLGSGTRWTKDSSKGSLPSCVPKRT